MGLHLISNQEVNVAHKFDPRKFFAKDLIIDPSNKVQHSITKNKRAKT
jgi:hypothetical protein